jgi:glycosyltransferase involved in cell wall biosynthesis
MKTKILFFIGTLSSGGKERRLLELLTYLDRSNQYELYLVTKKTDEIYSLQVKWIPLKSKKLKFSTFFEFNSIVRQIKPDIIHTWGNKQTFIALLPHCIHKNIKIVNSQITSAPPKIPLVDKLISKLNFRYSNVILSNSIAGVESYNPPKNKTHVIYNGLNFERFKNLPSKEEVQAKYSLNKKFTLVMIASYSLNKDYERFFQVGIELSKLRNDTIFLGVGYFQNGNEVFFNKCEELTKNFPDLRQISGISDVEALVNACDMGLLFSNQKVHGEGISNALIEYMALGKPVIANDAGGTREIIENDFNGYLIHDESANEIALKIHLLLDNPDKMKLMGERSKNRIYTEFSLERMGKEFEKVYRLLT